MKAQQHLPLRGLIERLVTIREDDGACLQAIQNSSELAQMSADEEAYCRSLLQSYCKQTGLLAVCPNNLVFAASVLAGRFGDVAGFAALHDLLERLGNPAIKQQIFWNIVRYAALRSVPCDDRLARSYFRLLDAWPIPPVEIGGLPPLDFDCVVLVSQFLTRIHAPTADTLDYCAILRGLGYHPLIVNMGELPAETRLPLVDGFAANNRQDLRGMMNVDERGHSFPIFTPPVEMPSGDGMAMVTALIRAVKPKLGIVVGGFSLLQEWLGSLVPTVIFPTTTDLVPSLTCSSVLFSELTGAQERLLANCGIPRSQVLDGFRYNYRLPQVESQNHSRTQFGADPDSFVIAIVGNRLPLEVDGAFRNMLECILRKNPRAFFLFVGVVGQPMTDDLQLQFGADRTGFIPFAKDLVGLYRACDLFLNPRRGGGGTSAAYALAASVPAFSLATGDVAQILPADCLFADYDAMAEGVTALIATADRSAYVANAAKAWSKISDRTALVKNVLARLPCPEKSAA